MAWCLLALGASAACAVVMSTQPAPRPRLAGAIFACAGVVTFVGVPLVLSPDLSVWVLVGLIAFEFLGIGPAFALVLAIALGISGAVVLLAAGVSLTAIAISLLPRRGGDDDDSEGPPPPFDWDRFEAAFRIHALRAVSGRRAAPSRIPAGARKGLKRTLLCIVMR